MYVQLLNYIFLLFFQPVFDGRSNLYTRDPLPIGNEKMELEVGVTEIYAGTVPVY